MAAGMDDPILEYNILDAICDNDGQLTQRHISQRTGRSLASVNFALRLLAVKGFVKISGANPRNLRYHLTPRGLLQKTVLAYDFLRRQSALYEEARKGLLNKLQSLPAEGVRRAAVFGWTPFTEAAILYLISEGLQVVALYMDGDGGMPPFNRIPLRPIQKFQEDCEVLILMEPLVDPAGEKVTVRKITCFPGPIKDRQPAP